MITDILLLILGLTLIIGGANFLTDGAAAIARRTGMSDLVVGLTIVAFGTSAPELVISVISAIDGNAGIAVGNVMGSNIFNILVIIGITAMVRPMPVGRSSMANEIPLVILASLALVIMASTPLLDGTPEAVITRSDGLILLLFFAIFMRYTFAQARRSDAPATPDSNQAGQMAVWRAAAYVAGGLGALIWGGQLFVDGASAVASALGVSDAVIGLTIVAAGTSLPELATSVTAAIKGNPGIAIGNVIGSNIFNIFLVLGAAASCRSLPVGNITAVDLGTLLGSALLFYIFGRVIGTRTITRAEGGVLTLCYAAYLTYLIVNIH